MFLARLGGDHQLENFVFVCCDLLIGKLDLVQQRLVLLVGLHVERLVAVLGNLPAQIGDCSFMLPPCSFVGFYSGARLFKPSFRSRQFLFDESNALGELRDFSLQALDFAVGSLQRD